MKSILVTAAATAAMIFTASPSLAFSSQENFTVGVMAGAMCLHLRGTHSADEAVALAHAALDSKGINSALLDRDDLIAKARASARRRACPEMF
jgi:hypothetical protein